MTTKYLALIGLLAIPANGAVIWSIGVDDGTQDGNGDVADGLNDTATFDGVSFNLSGVQEIAQNTLPGNPANAGGASGDAARDIDDDYYFAGVYDTVVDGSAYVPVGVVAAHESYYERAITNGDPNLRWHFNVPNTVTETGHFTFTIDFYNLSESNDAVASSYDLTFWVDGEQIGEMQPHSDVDINTPKSWKFELEDLGGVAELGSGFDHYVEIRSTSTGTARWASIDYVELDFSTDPLVSDDPNISVAPTLNFGNIAVDGSPSTETITITNTGTAENLEITDLAISGVNDTSFAFDAPALPITVAPGADVDIDVTVTPGAIEEPLSATLTVTSNDASDGTMDIVLAAQVVVPFADEGTLWYIGLDDEAQDGDGDATLTDQAYFNGTEFLASGVQETNAGDILPGSATNTGGSGAGRDVDDDYYFAGVYNTVVDGGAYAPVGIVAAHESYYDRAITTGDPNLRWHFNVPNTVGPNDAFTFTIDFHNLSEATPADESGYDLTFWVDGQQIGDTQTHSDADLAASQSWEFTLDDLGGVSELGPGFDHYVEIRSQGTGSAQWASLDYAKLDIAAGVNTELIITDLSVDPANNNVTFTFQSIVGRTYIIERSTSLLPGEWLELDDSFLADSEIESYTDPGAAAGSDKFFYRVREAE